MSPDMDALANIESAVPEPGAAAADDKQPTGRLIAHSLLNTAVTGVQLPIGVYLPAIYAQQYGISLTVLGAIFLVERIWGTATDPLVGWLCDKTRSRLGRRKVWIGAGSVLFVAMNALLFFPPAGVTPAFLVAVLLVTFLSLSMIQIPYYAWSGELSGDYHERTRITAYQTIASGLALFSVLLMPTLADRFYPGDQMMKLHGMGAAIILPVIPTVLLAFWAFPDHSVATPRVKAAKVPWRQASRAVRSEKVLFRVMTADLVITFAQGLRGALFVFFVSFVVGKPEWAGGLFLFQFVIGIFAAPIWQWIARIKGKHRALIATELGQAAVNIGLVLVGAGDIPLLLALTVAQGLMQGSGNMLLRAMLADIADEYRLRTGVNRTAMLFSVFSVSGKAGVALPVGIALPLIAWFGFDPKLAANTPTALTAVALVFSLGPGLAHLIGAALVRSFDIDEDRQVKIREELAMRAAD
ncbi:MFS transporter [Novosphingobium sp. G106]|uniref:MFS transporter n=1 Tax=Novosphingobium sp. G106 TaxID=2849500 RepID=UPI0020C3139D|nr:MFS transporter [Novosphingobium sp. G106]